MAAQKINLQKQAQTFARLKEELAELDRRFDEMKRAAGLPLDQKIPLEEVPAELAEPLQRVREAAAAASRQAVAAMQEEVCEKPASSGTRAPRRGAIAI